MSSKFRSAKPFPLLGETNVELIDLESLHRGVPRWHAGLAMLSAILLPAFVIDRFVLGLSRHRLDDPATVLFSVKNHGNLRGALFSHRNLAAAVASLVWSYDLSSRDQISGGRFEFDHCVGNTLTLWTPLSLGMNILYSYLSKQPEAAHRLRNLAFDHRCGIMRSEDGYRQLLAPTFPFSQLNDLHPQERGNRIGLEAYYCTELATIAATNVPDKTLEGFTQIGNKPGTVGQPLAGMAARVVNPETFEPLPAGQEGVLQFRSASLMKGYLDDDDATRRAIREGWFTTGDLARIDEQGFITIVPSK
jgi:acyl-[acyl-carrier-protein]-phospholipid O-acyltransferase/long-chain-fatty-acid--[acyl-carrier-protein] ligase